MVTTKLLTQLMLCLLILIQKWCDLQFKVDYDFCQYFFVKFFQAPSLSDNKLSLVIVGVISLVYSYFWRSLYIVEK